jgi:hypothetical protein
VPGAREVVFPAVPQIIGGGRILPSPSQFYLTGEDRLRIVSANSVSGVALKLQVRTATLRGDVQAQSFDHTPATDRSVVKQEFPIGEGSLLNATVFVGTGSPFIGQTYVMLQLVRGSGAAAIVLGTLLAGYVTATQALGFPGSAIADSISSGGCIRAIQGTKPAAGAEISETVPTGARWELVQLWLKLTASATVATRNPKLALRNSGLFPSYGLMISGPTAGQVVQFLFGQTWSFGTAAYAFGTHSQNTLPLFTTLLAGGGFATITESMQAGDQWEAPVMLVREWLEVL